MKRFVLYGILGLIIEITWTAIESMITGNINLIGRTSLWMFPIYGLGILFERVHDKIRNKDIIYRAKVWLILIYVIEYTTGMFLDICFNIRPWHYTGMLSVNGYITLAYIPAWIALGLCFERVHDILDKKTSRTYIKLFSN